MKKKKQISRIAVIVTATLLFLFFIMPFAVMLINSLKTSAEFVANPFSLPKTFHWENYLEALDRMSFWRSLRNSLFVTVCAAFLTALFASMTSYFISRCDWKISKIVYFAFIASMTAPFQSYMIPMVQILGGKLGLSNNLITVIYVAIGLNIPFSVFLYTGFMKTIPKELDEAALIDGCGMTGTFFRIILPLLKPILITGAVFVVLGVWNDYLMSSVFLSNENVKTLPLAIYTFLNVHSADYAPMMAGLIMSLLPVLVFYLVGQKYIIEGIVAGSVKG